MNRKLILMPVMVLTSLVVGNANAALTDDQGTVHFQGKIINPPCEVATDAKTVNVTFTPMGANSFADIGSENPQTQDVSIKLATCPADTTINLTFSGVTATTSDQLKAMTGSDATGVGIVMYGTGSAASSKVVFDNTPNAAFAQKTGAEATDLTFNYKAKVVATAAPADIKGGDFTADATYTIYYP